MKLKRLVTVAVIGAMSLTAACGSGNDDKKSDGGSGGTKGNVTLTLLAEVAGSTTLDVVCMHSQGAALPPIPKGLIITGHSAHDDEIHAVESQDGFFHGTQFHPEKMPDFGILYYAALFERWQR